MVTLYQRTMTEARQQLFTLPSLVASLVHGLILIGLLSIGAVLFWQYHGGDLAITYLAPDPPQIDIPIASNHGRKR